MALDLKQVPNTPGIYKFFSKNKIIYIGKAKDLRKRVSSYFGKSFKDRKTSQIKFLTDFQVKIWKLVSRIPYGTSLAYVKVAQAYGDAKMVRAVAAALAKNPLIILIPCHRVMGSDGSLVGYSAGIDKKRQLLELEGFPKQIAVN